jgi:hypothetical protein
VSRVAALALLVLAGSAHPHDLHFGDRVFNYRILEPLEDRPERAAYVAYESGAQRLVRLEVLEAPRSGGLRRFRRAAEALKLVRHPGIQRYLYSGMHQGHFFLVAEFHPGRSLATILRSPGAIDPLTACRITWKLAKALTRAHEEGLTAQALTSGDVQITDARVVLFTGMLQRGGTPANDQARLGALLRELLGQRVEDRPDAPEVLRKLEARAYPAMSDAAAALEELSR